MNEGPNRAVVGVLAVGGALAFVLMFLGAVVVIASGDGTVAAVPISELPRGLLAANPAAVVSAGIVVLLLTPVARVVVLLTAYARRRQWLFSGISFLVLAVLGLSIVLGL